MPARSGVRIVLVHVLSEAVLVLDEPLPNLGMITR